MSHAGFRRLLLSALALGCALPLQSAHRSDAARTVEPFIQGHTFAGAVVLVADRDRILSLDALGEADLATRAPMEKDELFWIASMSEQIGPLHYPLDDPSRGASRLGGCSRPLPTWCAFARCSYARARPRTEAACSRKTLCTMTTKQTGSRLKINYGFALSIRRCLVDLLETKLRDQL